MKQEYKYAKGWIIFLWILAPAIIGLFVWVGAKPYLDDKFDLTLALILTPLAVCMIILMILGLYDTINSKLIIVGDKIISIDLFKTKTLTLQQIKGFKKDKNYLYFIPSDEKLKRIKVSTYFGSFDELVRWAGMRLTNLDLQEIVDEQAEIFNNEDYGSTLEERELKLKKTKRITKYLNGLSWIVALSTWFYPRYYEAQIILCALLPVVGLLFYKLSKGLILLDEKPNSAHPNILYTLFLPSCVLSIRALSDFNIFDYSNLWEPFLVMFVIFGLLTIRDPYLKFNFKKGETYGIILGMLMFGGFYSYGVISFSNVLLDNNKPATYKAKVLKKRVSSGKSKTCHFDLSPWGPQTEVEEVTVTKDLYNKKSIGDTVVISFSDGLYRIPYFKIVE